jgi:murein DD-endopeptidase MepM/ murein hydrolase activator NlpD
MKYYTENARRRFADPLHGYSPAQRIFHRVTAMTVLLFTIHSIAVSGSAYDTGGSYDYDYLAIDPSIQLVADDEGYLTKVLPWDGQAQYLNRGDEFVTHEVTPGDTLSVIAYRYGLSMNTLLWANASLGSGNYLKVGQELSIPPTDGYEVSVKSGDSLDALYAKYYDGDKEKVEELKAKTIELNELASDGTLTEGAKLFIAGGEKPYEAPIYVASSGSGSATTTRVDPSDVNMEYDPIPVDGEWVQPTSGKITQWFHAGHYAIDISDTSMPPVVAAHSGTVTRAESDGGYHGGYGNVIVIDHGETELGSCQTLYAHNSLVHVSVGDYVEAGQMISNQGRTGRVYGKTGIHSHVEVICDGVKINPSFLFGY